MTQLDLTFAEVDPKTPVIAGYFATITFTYTAGQPMDCAGYMKIVFHLTDDSAHHSLTTLTHPISTTP